MTEKVDKVKEAEISEAAALAKATEAEAKRKAVQN